MPSNNLNAICICFFTTFFPALAIPTADTSSIWKDITIIEQIKIVIRVIDIDNNFLFSDTNNNNLQPLP